MTGDDRGQITLSIIILVISVLVIIFVGWVFVTLTDPIYNALTLAELEQQLNTTPGGTIMFFGGLGFIGLITGLIIWFIWRPLKSDVRQSVTRRF